MEKTLLYKAGTLVAAILLSFQLLNGRHIIGGTISYELLPSQTPGLKTVLINLSLIRDCNPAPGGAYFDDPVNIAVYKGTLAQNNIFTVWSSGIDAIFTGLSQVPNGVVINTSICEETGVYSFSGELPDLPTGESYYVVYQRCCKSELFTNIMEPSTVGMTLSIEITAEAMVANNNSPQFTTSAGVLACSHEALKINRVATDLDGDSLVYQISGLVSGGGPDIDGSSCVSIIPFPPCPPPFEQVNYTSEFFNAAFPLGVDTPFDLNPQTGEINTFPEMNGSFLMGLNVVEMRNGVVLSTIHSEFAIHIIDCLVSTQTLGQNRQNEVEVSPNPSTGLIVITSDMPQWVNANYQCINTTGAVVKTGQLQGGKAMVTRDNLDTGLLFIKITTESGSQIIKKVVVQ